MRLGMGVFSRVSTHVGALGVHTHWYLRGPYTLVATGQTDVDGKIRPLPLFYADHILSNFVLNNTGRRIDLRHQIKATRARFGG